MIKEPTATAFVFRRFDDVGWRVAMIWHRRLAGWFPPGGHVEVDESPAEAAVREVLEEVGCRVRLIDGLATPLPPGFPHPPVVAPWWIVEMPASPDSHTADLHVHVDHVFVAVFEGDVGAPETHVRWFGAEDFAHATDVAQDSRMQGEELFTRIDEAAARPPAPSASW
jgi:8-oxo-dGTP pyrophosphatase MutT (NUDIX family)